jgi:hypothetical protein
MDLKNLMSIVLRPVNPTTTGELSAPELAQLSEEDLLQIIGGDQDSIIQRIREAANVVVGQYTLEDLIKLIGPDDAE